MTKRTGSGRKRCANLGGSKFLNDDFAHFFMNLQSNGISRWSFSIALCVGLSLPLLLSAAEGASAKDNERQLITVLKSDAAPGEKAITCKKLAIYGSKAAVPALAPLLTDKDLTSWARIALEAIPGEEAAEALRNALNKVEGRILVGVINSIGSRKDAQAVPALIAKLDDQNAQVAAAAGEALGHIGGADAARGLERALAGNRPEVRSAAAYGCVLCAEQMLAAGQGQAAAELCDRVRRTELPKQRVLEATRGAILARGAGGIPLLIEQLKSPDAALFGIGVRAARELPGRDVTQAVATELDQANADRQVALLLALADRTDAAVLPKLLQVAETGPRPIRKTAVGLLDRFRDLACVPVLLLACTDNDADLARTAKSTLGRLGGKEVDADLLARLRLASGRSRQVLIELAGQRRIDAAIPIILRSTEDKDLEVRRAAMEAIGILGNEEQAGALVGLLRATQSADERDDIERALTAVCRRSGAKALPEVLPLAQTGGANLRKVGLRALSSIGGEDALGVIKTALKDSDPAIEDEAVNLLSTWPNTWPDDAGVAEPLLALARSGKKPAYRVQGLRGYLLYIEETKRLNNDEKVAKIKEFLPLAEGVEEKRQVISVVGTLPTPAAIDLLMSLGEDQSVAEEAYLALAKVASDRKLDTGLRRKALQAVAEKSPSEAAKKKANDELRKLK